MKKIVVGISGASGLPIALQLLKELEKSVDVQTHLVYTRGAVLTAECECPGGMEELKKMADVCYENEDIGAAIASGSFKADGMVIVPCSMKTVAGIHSGYADNLLLRAADVTIKEHRPLVLAARETPLSPIHLRNLYELSIMPEVRIIARMMAFYNKPGVIDDMIRHMAAKLLEPFGIEGEGYCRWKGL